jgi:tetratricopeptide (TPR) repeat protein
MTVSRTKLVGIALVLFAATAWLYWPSVHGDFLTGMDDDDYLQQAVRWNGLTWDAVKWAFTSRDPYYHPLPRLSHVLDYQIWGKNAAGHHATSVVVHALNAALVFGFLWTLLGATPLATGERLMAALCVAVVFAIHPLQVESVAWMSGRTQLLCATFGIGCLWAYVLGACRRLVWGLFVGALLCKPMAVSLPFVMLVMDYYPLRRYEQFGWARLLWWKAMLLALAAAAVAVTTISESGGGGLMVSLETVSPAERVGLMFQSLVFYPWKLIWPGHLSPFYPLRSGFSLDRWAVLASVLSVGVIIGLAVRRLRQTPAVAAGWGAYVTLVLPVSGLMQTGLYAVASRYAYLAMLPLLLLAGGAVVWVWRRRATGARVVLVGLVACELCLFGVDTRSLIPVWRDAETLWRAALVQFPDSLIVNRALMITLLDLGKVGEALEYAQRSVEIAPQIAESHNNLGHTLSALGRVQEAIGEYEQALRINPDCAEAQSNLGNALVRAGKIEEALGHYEQSLSVKPDVALTHYNLAVALTKLGRTQEAVGQLEQALKLRPDLAPARNALTRLRAGQ